MASLFVTLPAPAGNQPGAPVDVSAFGATKTVTVSSNGGSFQPFVTVEVSNDDTGEKWAPLWTFRAAGEQTFEVACRWMRAVVSNYRGGGSAVVGVGGTDDGTSFVSLPLPPGDGLGAGVDVSALPLFKTVQVGGAFRGSVNVEISEDGGITYSTAFSFSQPNIQSLVVAADFMRVSRNGSGTPTINIGATISGCTGSGFPSGGTLGAPLLSRGSLPSAWSTNNFFGNATIVELDGNGSVLRYNYRPEINPIDGADETTAIYVRLPEDFDQPHLRCGLLIEIPSTENFTHSGCATKVIMAGRGDGHFVAQLAGVAERTISTMTGDGVSPIVCTTPVPHAFGQGDVIRITGAVGNTAANGDWYGIDAIDEFTFSLPLSTGNGAYVPDSGQAKDISPSIGFEAAASANGVIGHASTNQHDGGLPDWQPFLALNMQNAIMDNAGFNALGFPNNGFSVTKQPITDATINGFTQYAILEANPRLKGGAGGPGATYRGGWDPDAVYAINDSVVLGQTAFLAVAPSTNDRPPSARWIDVTDATNNNRMRIGAYNNGEFIQSALASSSDTTFHESPEHRLRATYWDGGASNDLDAILKYVVTDTTPSAEFRIYLGPSNSPQLTAILRPHNTGGGDLDLQGGTIIGCTSLASDTTGLAFVANGQQHALLDLPADGGTAITVLTNVGEVLTDRRLVFGAPDSAAPGYRMAMFPN